MRIAVLTYGDLQTGSTKYRIADYEPFLRSQGIELFYISQAELGEAHLDEIASADLTINQKCLLGGALARKVVQASRVLLFDFDDAIYTRPGRPYSWWTQRRILRRLKFWLNASQEVTVANLHLLKFASRFHNNPQVIPMALDLDVWHPKTVVDDSEFTIGWAGAPVNLHHLERLDAILGKLLKKYPFLRLAVFSGKEPRLQTPFDYTSFGIGQEAGFIRKLSVGLLPLTDEEFSKGKSPIKALQYLASEVPVVGNFFGATQEILDEKSSIAVEDEQGWMEAIEKLILDPALMTQLGRAGRSHVEKYHDKKLVQKSFFQLICRAAGK